MKETNKVLKQKVIDLEAQMIHRYAFACKEIEKAGNVLTASAAVLSITALGGKEIVAPVAIRDGLSIETIEAIKKDLQRSYEQAVTMPWRCTPRKGSPRGG